MELIQILLIIIIVIVLLGFFTIKDKSNFLNRVEYKCPNCSSNTWLGEDACYSCNECGWCVDPYGNGSCARGNEYGPLFKQCQSWSYKGECMWGPECGNNGQIYITDHNTNPYPWYLRWFWPRYRTDYYDDDYDDTNNVYTVNNYNYHINKYKKKNKLRKKFRRLRRKNRQLIKKHELPNLIKPIIIKKRNINQRGGQNMNQLNIRRESRRKQSRRRQSRRRQSRRRQSRRRQSRRRQSRRRQSRGRQGRRN